MSNAFNIKIDSKEIEKAMKNLQGFKSVDMMQQISGILLTTAQLSFGEQRDPSTGQRWQPLTEAYAAKKMLAGKSDNILEWSGDLQNRLVSEATDSQAMAGSNLVYAGTHQFGNPNLNIPARPFLGIDDVAEEEILDAIRDHYSRAII